MQHLRARTGVCEKNDPRPHVRVGSPAPHPRISMLPATAARVRAAAKKTTLLVPSPPAPWINIEIRGERGGHWLCKRKCGRVVFFANTGLGILCLCALSQRISGRARASRVYTRPINGPLSRAKRVAQEPGPPRMIFGGKCGRAPEWCSAHRRVRIFAGVAEGRMPMGTRAVCCASQGANPR